MSDFSYHMSSSFKLRQIIEETILYRKQYQYLFLKTKLLWLIFKNVGARTVVYPSS